MDSWQGTATGRLPQQPSPTPSHWVSLRWWNESPSLTLICLSLFLCRPLSLSPQDLEPQQRCFCHCRGRVNQLLQCRGLCPPFRSAAAAVRFVYKLRVGCQGLVPLHADFLDVLPTTARPRGPPASHLVDVYTAIMAETRQGSMTNNPIPKRCRRIAREIEKNYNTLSTFMKMKQTQARGGNWQTSCSWRLAMYDAPNVS